jgi:transposase
MMSAALSRDLRERIVTAYQAGGVSYRMVAERFGVSHGVVHKLVQQQRAEGSLAPHTDRCGRKRAVAGQTQEDLQRHLREQPDATLEERRDALGLTCSLKTIWESARRLNARFKKSPTGRPSKTGPMWPEPVATGTRRSRE